MAAGAATATGDWLLFLHADPRPQPGWEHAAKAFMVKRARRIWGRLGSLLRDARMAKEWREKNCVPHIILRWVRTWRGS